MNFSRIAFFLFVTLIFAGCTAVPDTGEVESAVGTIAGADRSIALSVEGEPLDVDGPPLAQLTLREATARAVMHDPQLQVALANLRAAAADAQQARLLPNPMLNLALRFPEGGGESIIDASLAIDLVSILQQPRRASAADNRLRAAGAEVLGVALDAVQRVQEQYALVQSLDAQIALLQDRGRVVDQLLGLAQRRVEVGEAASLDVLTFETERVGLAVDLAQKTSEQKRARIALARMIGEPSHAADWQLDPFAPSTEAPLSEAAFISAALKDRPEVQVRRWELAALGDEEALIWPFDSAEIGVDSEREGDWSVGPSIAIPIPFLDWGQARRDRASAEVIATRHRLVDAQRRIVEEVRQAHESVESSEANLRLVREQLMPLQKRQIDLAQAAYTNGQATITTVLLAEQASQSARQRLIELQHEVATAHSRLRRAAGGRVVAATTQPSPTTSESR